MDFFIIKLGIDKALVSTHCIAHFFYTCPFRYRVLSVLQQTITELTGSDFHHIESASLSMHFKPWIFSEGI